MQKPFQTLLLILGILCLGPLSAAEPHESLEGMYLHHCHQPSDINEHIPVLRKLASECASVTEIGVCSIVSTWGILQGLSENGMLERKYLGIDLQAPDMAKLELAKRLAEEHGIDFTFWAINDMEIEKLEEVDMLFIDSLHTYCHLTYELETFSPASVNTSAFMIPAILGEIRTKMFMGEIILNIPNGMTGPNAAYGRPFATFWRGILSGN